MERKRMLNYDFSKMLFTIPADRHGVGEIRTTLLAHPEIKFVSLVGIDIGGHDTDEKIPVREFLKDIEAFLEAGVQTDGSSVVLPKIADLNNAKVDIIPDRTVNWFVDHNFSYPDPETGLPVGTLRIPSSLIHDDNEGVGSRVILRDAIRNFKDELIRLMKEHPYVLKDIGIDSADDISEIVITAATELEFWVRSPDDDADREQLSTAQLLKEQYWKRTTGSVRTAMEEAMLILDHYGFEMEMGHKEVGGVKAKLENSGNYDHDHADPVAQLLRCLRILRQLFHLDCRKANVCYCLQILLIPFTKFRPEWIRSQICCFVHLIHRSFLYCFLAFPTASSISRIYTLNFAQLASMYLMPPSMKSPEYLRRIAIMASFRSSSVSAVRTFPKTMAEEYLVPNFSGIVSLLPTTVKLTLGLASMFWLL